MSGTAPHASSAEQVRAHELLHRVLARDRRRVVARLARRLGLRHLALAEDAMQVAALRAWQRWPRDGLPASPLGWLYRVAQREAIDQLRRAARERPWPAHDDEPADLPASAVRDGTPDAAGFGGLGPPGAHEAHDLHDAPEPHALHGLHDPHRWLAVPPAVRFAGELDDDELALLFAACHPSLPPASQVVLALRVATNLPLELLAEGLFSTPAALAQRLARARGALAGESLALPAGAELAPRREAVSTVLALMFRCGLRAAGGRSGPIAGAGGGAGAAAGGSDRGEAMALCWESVRLARALAAHPATAHADADALAATLLLHGARLTGRFDDAGDIVPLPGQPRDRWDAGMVRLGLAHLDAARRAPRLSRWHLMAGIAAEHATAPEPARTDWAAIVRYYEMLLALDPSPAPRLAHAIALAEAGEPARARDCLRALQPVVPAGLRAHLLAAMSRAVERAGDIERARSWLAEAVACAPGGPEGADGRLLARRLRTLGGPAA